MSSELIQLKLIVLTLMFDYLIKVAMILRSPLTCRSSFSYSSFLKQTIMRCLQVDSTAPHHCCRPRHSPLFRPQPALIPLRLLVQGAHQQPLLQKGCSLLEQARGPLPRVAHDDVPPCGPLAPRDDGARALNQSCDLEGHSGMCLFRWF